MCLSDGETDPVELQPSLEIRALHNLIGRYWNVVVPSSSAMSGTNMLIILYLHDHQDCDVFQYDIEHAFSITRSTASRVLALMEKKGMITRSAVDWDARVRKIELTDEGKAFVQEINTNACILERTLFQGFDTEQQQQIMKDLAHMKENILSTGLISGEKSTDEIREHHDEKKQQGSTGEESDLPPVRRTPVHKSRTVADGLPEFSHKDTVWNPENTGVQL